MYEFHEPYHELRNVSELTVRLFHVEAFSKAKIAEDIENQIRDLISHIDRTCPFAALFLLLANQLQPPISIGMHEDFSTSQRALRKRIVDHTALPGMYWERGGAPCVDVVHSLWPNGVVLALLDIALGAKDMLVG